MRGHIVGTFRVVREVRRVFRGELVEMPFQIPPNGWIGILVYCKGRGCVLDEEMKDPPPEGGDLGKHGEYLGGHEMKPALPRLESDLFLNAVHSEGSP